MSSIERKQRNAVKATIMLQLYTHLHDKEVNEPIMGQKVKNCSHILISHLEKDCYPFFGRLGKVKEGEPYYNSVAAATKMIETLAELPIEKWSEAQQLISQLK